MVKLLVGAPNTGVLWADIILSLIAFGIAVVALPSVFQTLWGRPNLELEFERTTEEARRMLAIFLKNPPVRSRMLKFLRVSRDTIQSLTGSYQVSESGSGKIVDPIRHALFFTDEELEPPPKQRIALPPTYSVGTSFPVVIWLDDSGGAMLAPDRLRDATPISPGLYLARIIMMVDGNKKQYERKFRVGQKADDLVWISPQG